MSTTQSFSVVNNASQFSELNVSKLDAVNINTDSINAHSFSVDSITFVSDSIQVVDGHFLTSQTTAPVFGGTLSGDIFSGSTDIAGNFNVTDATTIGATVVITFNKSYPSANVVVTLMAANQAAATQLSTLGGAFVTSTAENFTVTFGVAVASPKSFTYSVIGLN